jgi:hypothetical protein
MNKTYISLAVVIIGIVGVFVLFNENQNKTTTNTGSNEPQSSTGMMMESNSIAVATQGESNTLIASMVMLTDPGFIVVHEDNNGAPGAVIGTSSLINPGMSRETVTLSRKLVKGEKVYAMLHKDNGDKQYSSLDQPVIGKSGEPIMMIVTVGPESGTPGEVSI